MEQVPIANYPENLYEALTEADSKYRWSWKKQALFRISDVTNYEKRLDYYWDFVETFYRGVICQCRLNRTRGFQFFEFCNRRIVVAAFDSIAGNDCFSHSGSIPRGAIGKCAIELRDRNHSYNLKIAVWHHSVQDRPLDQTTWMLRFAGNDRSWFPTWPTWSPTHCFNIDQFVYP